MNYRTASVDDMLKVLHDSNSKKEELSTALRAALSQLIEAKKELELAKPLVDAISAVAAKVARSEVDEGPTRY